MRFSFKFIMTVCCLLLIFRQGAFAASDEWELWKKGFETYEQGEENSLAGNRKEALVKFKAALEFFTQVKKTKPNWNKKVIDYRIDLCSRKIESITKAIALENDAPPKNAAKQPPQNTKTTAQDAAHDTNTAELKKELEKYKDKLFEATVMLENNKREIEKNKKASDEIKSLLKDKLELEKQCSAMTLKYEELKNKTSQPSTEALELKQKLISEKTASDKFKQAFEKISAENEALKNQRQELLKNKTQLTYELKNLSDKSAEINSENKKFQAKLADKIKVVDTNNAKIQALEKQKEDFRIRCEKKSQEYDALYKEIKTLREKTDLNSVGKQMEKENELFRKNIDSLQAKIDKVSEENAKLKVQLNQKTSEFTQLNETLAAISKHKEALEQDLKIFTSKYEKSDITIKNQKQYISELEERNKKFNNDLKLFADKNEKLQDKIKSLSTSKTPESSTKENELSRKLAQLSETNKNFEEKLKNLEGLKDVSAKNTELSAKNQALAKTVTELSETNRKLEDNIKALTPLKDLSTKNQALAKTVTELSETNKKLEDNIKALAPLKDLSAKNIELSAKNTELSTKIQELAKTVSELSEAKKQIEGKLEIMSETRDSSPKIAKLNTKNQELAKTVSELTEANKQLQKTVNTKNEPLEKQLKTLTQENAALKHEIATVKNSKGKVSTEKASTEETEKKNTVLASLKKQAEEINSKLKKQFNEIVQPDTAKVQDNDKDKKTEETEPPVSVTAAAVKTPEPHGNTSGETEKMSDKSKKTVNDGTITFLLKNAEKAEKENDTQSALWHYNKVLKFAPDNYDANKRLGFLYVKEKANIKAFPYLEKAYKLNDGDVEVMLPLASIEIENKRYKAALEILNKTALLAPKNPILHRYMGIVCQYTGKNDFAEKEFRKSIELDPKSSETALCIAIYLSTFKEKMAEARDWYKKALRLGAEPTLESQKIFGSDAAVMGGTVRKKAAIDEFQKKDVKGNIAQQFPDKTKNMDKANLDKETVQFLLDSAEKHEKENDFKSAAWELSKASSLSPDNPEILKKLGVVYMKIPSEGKALNALEEAYRLKSEDAEIILPLATLYIKNGKYSQALNMLNMAAVLDPKNAVVQRYMGIACKSLGQKENADRAFRKAMELDPSSPDTALEMAMFLAFSCYKNEEAKEWYLKAKELGAKPNQLLERIVRK
ncbi:MAG: hypothetical protein A2017_07675 [Lentisphaerae bacterium GWF2_44_16]|nr:MAG: hypothetical protein A2017_07675 [Lentisphaerae bacterium GWF2_44_16]